MLKYTLAAFNKSIDDVKRANFLINIMVNALYIIYLVYALVVGNGNPFINATLCALTVVFVVSYIITSLDERKKRALKIVKTTYKRIKIFLDAFSLAIAIYSIYITAEHVTVISLLLTVGSFVGWAAKVVLSILTRFLENRAELIMSAFQVDFEPLFKVHNTYKRLIGDEVGETVSPEMRAQLDEICLEYMQEKEAKKHKRRETRRMVRQERYDEWRDTRAAKKEAKKENAKK